MMVLAFILAVTLICGGAAVAEGNWGIAVVTGIVLVLSIAASVFMDTDVKAYENRRRYWAEGGPDRHRDNKR